MADTGPYDHSSSREEEEEEEEVEAGDALATAAARGDLRRVRRLLAAGANVNRPNMFGRTPLQVVKCCCADVTERLLEAGANPNVQDRAFSPPDEVGHTPSGRYTSLVIQRGEVGGYLLVQSSAGTQWYATDGEWCNTLVTLAHDVAREGFMDTMRCLLRHGADITLKDVWGNSPAHLAAKHGHYDILRLLKRGLILTRCTNQYGMTPLDYIKFSAVDRKTLTWIQWAKTHPPSLKGLSCIVIRQSLAPDRLALYTQLPISDNLQRYIAFQDKC